MASVIYVLEPEITVCCDCFIMVILTTFPALFFLTMAAAYRRTEFNKQHVWGHPANYFQGQNFYDGSYRSADSFLNTHVIVSWFGHHLHRHVWTPSFPIKYTSVEKKIPIKSCTAAAKIILL